MLGLTVRIVEDHFGHDLTLPSCGSITRGSNGSAVPIHLCTHVTRGGVPAFRCEEDRSAAERGVLRDATIMCLVELGCAGTAGAAVAQKAGLSRGAQPHHCGDPRPVGGRRVEHLAQKRLRQVHEQATELARSAEPRAEANASCALGTFAHWVGTGILGAWIVGCGISSARRLRRRWPRRRSI